MRAAPLTLSHRGRPWHTPGVQTLKLVVLVLGLALVAFAAKLALTGTTGAGDPAGPTQPSASSRFARGGLVSSRAA